MTKLRGFPYKAFPRGWYQIAWSQELSNGDVRPAKYFGKDIVIYRTESGTVKVLDAFCRHMGAHLGHGGKVSGDDITCPFHGWKWNAEGENVEIPYSSQAAVKAKISKWPVIEQSGLVLIWYDAERAAPDFTPPPVPEFEDSSYYPVYPEGIASGKVPFPPQLLVENAVDFPHLYYVHNWNAGKPGIESIEDRGSSFYVKSFGHIMSPRGPAAMMTEISLWGVGLVYSHLSGLRDMGFTASVTPIDDEYSQVFLTAAVKRKEGDLGSKLDSFAKSMVAGQVEEVLGTRPGGDRDIWEHMEYQPNPALVREELPGWRALKKWTAKFYADAPEYQSLVKSADSIK